MSKLNEALIKVQTQLKAPKSQFNAFAKYKYRNCEDILEALKPLLEAQGLLLYITDEVREVRNVIFLEATVTIKKGDETVTSRGMAGIDIMKKGMDAAQCFGSSSSYARKYALNGMFLIDDTKDSDGQDNKESNGIGLPHLQEGTDDWSKLVAWVAKDPKNNPTVGRSNFQITDAQILLIKTQATNPQ